MRHDPPLLVQITPQLNRQLRKKAAAERRTLRVIVEMALIEFLNKDTTKDKAASAAPAIPETVAG